jgi:hypothetical protein
MPDDYERWEMMRAAILRYQADPTPENYAEMRRRSRAFEAVFCGDSADEGREAA